MAKAREAFERAVIIAERVYGKEHPEVAPYLCSLGMVLMDLGEWAAALAIVEKLLPAERRGEGGG